MAGPTHLILIASHGATLAVHGPLFLVHMSNKCGGVLHYREALNYSEHGWIGVFEVFRPVQMAMGMIQLRGLEMDKITHLAQLGLTVISKRIHMASAILTTYAIITHFGHRRRIQRHRSFWNTFLNALQSRTMYGTLTASLIMAYLLKRIFILPPGRVFALFFVFVWSLIYRWRIVENPVVSFRRTLWNSTLVERARIVETPFEPVPWAFNRHAQSISLYALSNLEWLWAEPIRYVRETIPAFDAPNVLHLDWAKLGESVKHKIRHRHRSETPVIILIHGLGDDREIPYLKRCARHCIQHGYRVCAYSYWRHDFEESRDLAHVVDHIQAKFPRSQISVIAWSAGCYPLIRYLEKSGEGTPLVAAVCQSGCLDFPQAVDDVLGSENPTYGIFLAHQNRVCIRRHADNDKTLTEAQRHEIYLAIQQEPHPLKLYNRFLCIIKPSGSLRTKPEERHALGHEGYLDLNCSFAEETSVRTASHYKFKAIDHLASVAVTTLILHAEDDPVVTSHHVDWSKVEHNRHIIVAHTKRGGHCGWYEGITPFGNTWGDRVALSFVSAVIETHSQTAFILDLIQQSTADLSVQQVQLPLYSAKRAPLSNLSMTRVVSASDLATISTNIKV